MKTATNSLPDADCNATVSAKVLRMRSHREKCPSAARPAKQPLADLNPEPAPKTSTPSKTESASPVSKDLCSLAQKILKMPSSSASIERVFSNSGLIQTKLRNRLGLQKATKLVFSYRYLRGKEDIDW